MFPHERSLVQKLAGKPFALIGVNSDKDRSAIRPRLEQEKITWRSFWNGADGTRGPIAMTWGVRGWPTIYIIDQHGVIRDMNKRGEAMEAVVEKLLGEAEQATRK